jgi:hypothetical protein
MLTALFGGDECDPLEWALGADGARPSDQQHAPTCFGGLLDGIKGPMKCDRIILIFSGSGALART